MVNEPASMDIEEQIDEQTLADVALVVVPKPSIRGGNAGRGS